MGTLGWTEAETLDTTMAGILLAYEGRMDLLKSIFGGGDPPPKGGPPKAAATPTKLRSALRMLAGGERAGTKRPGKGQPR